MKNVIIKDQKILGGEPVFRGTRVPFKILIDYLEGGDTLGQFLEQYPSVSRELAIVRPSKRRVPSWSHSLNESIDRRMRAMGTRMSAFFNEAC
jgi:hypothetical protein